MFRSNQCNSLFYLDSKAHISVYRPVNQAWSGPLGLLVCWEIANGPTSDMRK